MRCSDEVVHRTAALSDACDTCDPACTAPPNLLCATDVFSGACFCVAACQTDVWRRGLRELVGPAASALQLGRLGQLGQLGRPRDHAVAAAAFGRVQPEVRA